MTEPAATYTALPTDDTVTHVADLFRLLGDPTRLRIVLACLRRPTSVGDIAARTGSSLSLVSHHLRLLRAARVLKAERRGRQVFYSACDEHIVSIVADMVAHVGEPAPDGIEGDGA